MRLTGYQPDRMLEPLELYAHAPGLLLGYAVGMSRTPVEVPDTLFARLREHFDEAQLVELMYVIAWEHLRGRFNLALSIGAEGFSAGMVCAVPTPIPQSAPGRAATS